MKYKRLTNNKKEEYNPEYDFCCDCKYYGEPNGCNRWNGECANYERFMEMYDRLAELEDMIESKKLVFVPEYSEKYAIIKYTFWKNQPFDIAIYYPCGVKMNGDIEYAFSGIKSGNITVIEDGFDTKEEAEAKLKELKNK